MHRGVRRELVTLGLVLLTAGCNNSNSSATTTPTSTTTITESFGPASLTKNGAITWTFAISVGGAVGATLQTVSPDSSIVVGLDLGTWNGTGCQIVLPNNNAQQGTSIAGEIQSAGNLCVRVYDVGNVVHPEAVSVVVTHL